jgi:hypothetical protein
MEDCVRARVRSVPDRQPAQFRQLQFHWGKPPPAADPRTRIFTDMLTVDGRLSRDPLAQAAAGLGLRLSDSKRTS